jgi:hypothetical protein
MKFHLKVQFEAADREALGRIVGELYERAATRMKWGEANGSQETETGMTGDYTKFADPARKGEAPDPLPAGEG